MATPLSFPPAPSSVAPGTVLAGKYRVERVLGEGGMGFVVLARHIDLDERVALKFLRQELAQHPEAAPRFLREARAAVKIKSAHVARVLDVGRLEGDAPFMVMEFLEGSDLSAVLAKHGKLAVEDAVDHVIQAAEALAEAHAHGIVHRDVKPSNLFLTRRPDGQPLVKVLDFGISKVQGVEVLTRSSVVMGSTPYMPPEQMESTRDVDARADVYSLGATLYELLAGRLPFQADSTPHMCAMILRGASTPLRDLRPEVPAPLAAVVHKAFALQRTDRYPSVAAFADALAPFAPERSLSTLAAIRGIAAAAPVSDPEAVAMTALANASTMLDSGGVSASPPVTAAGVSKSSRDDAAPRESSGRRRAPMALGALLLLGGAGLFALWSRGTADVATARPAPPPSSTAPAPIAEPSPASAPGAAPSVVPTTIAAPRRVRLVILPADATAEIDDERAEAHDGVLEILGPLGSVHRVRLSKDKQHVEGDVVVTEAGAMPPKLEISSGKPVAPAKVKGKPPRFGFYE